MPGEGSGDRPEREHGAGQSREHDVGPPSGRDGDSNASGGRRSLPGIDRPPRRHASGDAPGEGAGGARPRDRAADAVVGAIDTIESAGRDESAFDRFAYRLLSGWFRERRERFDAYRRRINEARIPETYDRYLARATLWTGIYAAVGATMGIAAVFLAGNILSGSLGAIGLDPTVRVPATVPDPVVGLVEGLSAPVAYLLGALAGGLALGGPLGLYFWYRPRYEAAERERAIDYLLPQAVTYMFAMSHGEVTFPTIVRSLAEDEEAYGEVAREFQAIQNNMDYFGVDLRTALREARETTPSDELAELFDDLISIIDSGGALLPFFRDKADEYQERARRRKDDFLDTLGFFAEIYVTVGVIAVLMLLVVVLVLVSLSGEGLVYFMAIIYLGIPAVSALFLVVVDSLTADDRGTVATLPYDEPHEVTPRRIRERLERDARGRASAADGGATSAIPAAAAAGGATSATPEVVDPTAPASARRDRYSRTSGHDGPLTDFERAGLAQLQAALRRRRVFELLRAPFAAMRDRPLYSLAVSVPAALALVVAFALTGISVPTPANLVAAPVWVTIFSAVVPAVVVLAPLSYYHERRRYHQRRVNRELPDLLQKLASATETGMTLGESIDLVSRSSTGYLAGELRKVNAELSSTNVSLEGSLVRLANRVENTRLTRVLNLLIEANTSGGRVREVLSVTARDAEMAHRLERERVNEMMLYVVIIALGNLLFLAIAAVLVTMLLPTLAEAVQSAQQAKAQMSTRVASSQTLPLLEETIDVDVLKLLLFHGVLIQAVGTGFLAGKLGQDDTWAGTKYAIAQMLVAVPVFVIA